jgi:hypothetical protein
MNEGYVGSTEPRVTYYILPLCPFILTNQIVPFESTVKFKVTKYNRIWFGVWLEIVIDYNLVTFCFINRIICNKYG